MAGLAGLVIGSVWLVARGQARRLARPLEQSSINAERPGDGDFSVRTRPGGIPEIDAVGSALNSTAGGWTICWPRNEPSPRTRPINSARRSRASGYGLKLHSSSATKTFARAIGASLTEADRLEQTIDKLLALARDSGGTPRRPVDLHAALCLGLIRTTQPVISTPLIRQLSMRAGTSPRVYC